MFVSGAIGYSLTQITTDQQVYHQLQIVTLPSFLPSLTNINSNGHFSKWI